MSERDPESTIDSRAMLEDQLRRHRSGELEEYNVVGNHVPMVLIALHRLGADPDLLERYARLRRRSVTADSDGTQALSVTRDNWTVRCGDLTAWSSYRRFFQSEVDRCSHEDVLRRYLPHLMSGVAGHAFHPILRVAYGIDKQDSEEIAFGLAYWAAAYLRVPAVPSNRSAVAPLDLLDLMSKSKRLRAVKSESPSIAGRVRAIYAESRFQELLQPIQWVAERPIGDVATAIAQMFSHTHHLTILHAVTSCHAFRLILPYIQDVGQAIAEYWHAICAAYLTVVNVSPGGQDRAPEANVSWRAVFKKAVATSVDEVVRFEHTVKLVYTCFKEWECYGLDIYQALAVREVDTPSPFA